MKKIYKAVPCSISSTGKEWSPIEPEKVSKGDTLKVINVIEDELKVETMYFKATRSYNHHKKEIKGLTPLITKPKISYVNNDIIQKLISNG